MSGKEDNFQDNDYFLRAEMEALTGNLAGGLYRLRLVEPYQLDEVGEGILKLVGYKESEIRKGFNEDGWVLIHEDDWPRYKKNLTELAQKPDIRKLEYCLVKKDGSPVWVEDTIRSIRMPDGAMWAFGVIQDVYKDRMDLLNFQTMLNAVPAGIVIYEMSADGIMATYFNDTAATMLGYTREEYERRTRKDSFEMVYDADWPDVQRKLDTLFAEESGTAVQYRAADSGGRLIWLRADLRVMDRIGGNVRFSAVLLNVNEEVRHREQERLREERYRIIAEVAAARTFDYDVERDVMVLSENFGETGQKEQVITGYLSHLDLGRTAAEPAAQAKFRAAIHKALKSPKSGDYEYQADFDGRGYRIHYVTMADMSGKVYRALGSLDDIQKEKEEVADLRDAASHDSLTGLLNRKAFDNACKQVIGEARPKWKGAFFIIDLDDFKGVNDRYGHAVGDDVLRKVADCLQNSFRKHDFVVRMGGDEMAVFMTDITGPRAVIRKGRAICQEIGEIHVDGLYSPLSVSVGMALYPDQAGDMEELYEKADMALYQAKSFGKNQAMLFDGVTTAPHTGDWMNKEWMLDALDIMIYISDTETYEMYYMNKAMMRRYGITSYRGMKCYEILQKHTAPCDFCTNGCLDYDSFYEWEYNNPFFQCDAILKDKLVTWNGHRARMEIVREIEKNEEDEDE